jgi:hypothetical protein
MPMIETLMRFGLNDKGKLQRRDSNYSSSVCDFIIQCPEVNEEDTTCLYLLLEYTARVYTYTGKHEATQLTVRSKERRGEFLQKLLRFNSVHVGSYAMKPYLLTIFPQ